MSNFTINAAGPTAAVPVEGVAFVAVGAVGETFTGTIDLEAEYQEAPGKWFKLKSYTAAGADAVTVPNGGQVKLRLKAAAGITGSASAVVR